MLILHQQSNRTSHVYNTIEINTRLCAIAPCHTPHYSVLLYRPAAEIRHVVDNYGRVERRDCNVRRIRL